MGRLLRELLQLSNPKKTIYLESCSAFYDIATGKEVNWEYFLFKIHFYIFYSFTSSKKLITMKTIAILHKCIGVSGLNGLDKLLSYMIINDMRSIIKTIPKEIDANTRRYLSEVFNEIRGLTSFIDKLDKIYFQLNK